MYPIRIESFCVIDNAVYFMFIFTWNLRSGCIGEFLDFYQLMSILTALLNSILIIDQVILLYFLARWSYSILRMTKILFPSLQHWLGLQLKVQFWIVWLIVVAFSFQIKFEVGYGFWERKFSTERSFHFNPDSCLFLKN